MNPYFLMAVLYISVAVLMAVDASMTSYNLLPWFNGLRWLRVHFITLGALTEVIFGTLPLLVAIRANRPRPPIRWDIWGSLNIGLVVLLVGIPLVNLTLILAGGTLVFIAAVLLWLHLYNLRPEAPTINLRMGRKFYLAGIAYLLVGIIVGTGLWMGWAAPLHIAVPLEVHIHANNWGFMSLVFAGLLVDLYPKFAGRSLAWPNSINPLFWMMTLGALGLTLGPWFQSLWFTVPGLVLHLTATVWLLLNVIKPIWGDKKAWTPGMWHIVVSYAWLLAPVLMAPVIILGVNGFDGAGIEQNAPQALIYGWVLQFGYALVPYIFGLLFLSHKKARLGGNWFSLITVNLGGVFLWASIFGGVYQAPLHATAYALWAMSILPIVAELWRIVRSGLDNIEDKSLTTFSENMIAID